MLEPGAAATLLVDTIKYDRRHQWYPRTVKYADKLLKIITGEGAEDLLQHIVARETKEQFALRKKLFFPLPPAVCNRARVPFAKVPKADGLVETITYEGDDNSGKRQRLDDAMDGFYGEESLDDYMNDRYLDLNFMDPNAWVLVEFLPFDHNKETAQPYPLEVTSAQAINYSKVRNVPEWLIGKFDITYNLKVNEGAEPVEKKGNRYVMYFGWIWDLWEIEFSNAYDANKIDPTSNEEQLVNIKGHSFRMRLIDPFSDRQQKLREFQGIQVGHVKDKVTGGETFLSPIHAGINRMMETLKSGNEFTLVMTMQAHPKVFQYLPKCTGDAAHNAQCNGGKDPHTGEDCTICHGTGRRIPTSVLDVVTMDLPPDAEDKDLISLEKLQHFSAPEVAIIQFLWQYLRDAENRMLQDIFSSVSVSQMGTSSDGTGPDTAAKVNVDADAQNDAVYPYGLKYATVKTKIVRMTALFVDAERGLDYAIRIPSDLKLEPLKVMVDNMLKAKGTSVYAMLEEDVVKKKLREKPQEQRKFFVKKYHRPMEGREPDEKKFLLAAGLVAQRDLILLGYENTIYNAMDRVANFYTMEPGEREVLIYAEAEKILATLQAEKVKEIDFGAELRQPDAVAA